MANEQLQTKASNSDEVDAFMKKLKHPLKDATEELRKIILAADKNIGEEIAWNAPAFFYAGKLAPFNAKEYKRHIVVFNFFKKDCLRLIFLKGANVPDRGLLEGAYTDGRRLVLFHSLDEVKSKKKEMQAIVKDLVKFISKK